MSLLDRMFGRRKAAEPKALTRRSGHLAHFQSLTPGEALTSRDGATLLALTHEGVLQLMSGDAVLWSPPVTEKAAKLLLEGSGRLSLWSQRERIWMAGDASSRGTELHVQDDGNLVLYDGRRPVWASRS